MKDLKSVGMMDKWKADKKGARWDALTVVQMDDWLVVQLVVSLVRTWVGVLVGTLGSPLVVGLVDVLAYRRADKKVYR